MSNNQNTMINNETTISKDAANKKITVIRQFDAPLEKVWKAWTEKDLLDTWWAPKPWRAKTKSMDFREGGTWFYSMVGPDGTESFCRVDFKTIVPNQSFVAKDAFCDEKGNISQDFPSMHWKNVFSPNGTGTKVQVEITFDSEEDMNKIVEMGFEEGFTAAHGNLDEILKN